MKRKKFLQSSLTALLALTTALILPLTSCRSKTTPKTESTDTETNNGDDGVGIETIVINEKGELIITLTNGKVENAGVIVDKSAQTKLAYVVDQENGFVTIKGRGLCPDMNVVIPEELEGYPVTMIVASAFSNDLDLKSITIPDSITSIGYDAFKDCSGLTSVTIGNSVTSIGWGAFSGCSNLQYNEYDNGYYLGNASNPYVVLVKAKDTSITSCNIHEQTKIIYQSAFSGCTGLTSITIPNSVTSIGNEAFQGWSNLQYNEYDNGYYLGNASNPYVVLVKAKDKSITSCTIHEQTKFIYQSAFYDCSGLTSITIPNSVTSIGERAFRACTGLTSITIPNSVTSIGDMTFYWCTGLTSITIPNSVTNIGDYAFQYCSGLTSITIPDSVTSIGNSAFCGCSKLTSITIPDSVTSIGSYAFYYCSGLTSITIPNSVTSIGDWAFSGCSGLTSITYQGTKAQWNAINKGSAWDGNTGSYTIHCTDGTIPKE